MEVPWTTLWFETSSESIVALVEAFVEIFFLGEEDLYVNVQMPGGIKRLTPWDGHWLLDLGLFLFYWKVTKDVLSKKKWREP